MGRDGPSVSSTSGTPQAQRVARAQVFRTITWSNGDASFTPVFKDPSALAALGPGLAEPFRDRGITVVVSPEARGFILGALSAVALNVGFLSARKPSAPNSGDKVTVISEPDWKGRRIEFRLAKVLQPADRVLLVDDWIETGSQASAIADAVSSMGATLIGTSVIVNQASPAVCSALKVVALIQYGELHRQDE